MKATAYRPPTPPPAFVPVTLEVTIETAEELKALRAVTGANHTAAKAAHTAYGDAPMVDMAAVLSRIHVGLAGVPK